MTSKFEFEKCTSHTETRSMDAKRHDLLKGTKLLRYYGSKMFRVRDEKAAGQLSSKAAKREMSRHCRTHNNGVVTLRKPAMTERFISIGERENISCAKRTPLTRIAKFTSFTKQFNPLPQGARENGHIPSPEAWVQVSFAKQTYMNLSLFTSHFSRKCKRYAFTLAETLITLGIIGVVAAMTMASVVTKYQKHVTINKLKNAYSTINNAMEMAKVDYGTDVNQWDFPETDDVFELSDYFAEKYLIPYLKITKDCKGTPKKCIKDTWEKCRTFVIADGAIIAVNVRRENYLRVQMNIYINGYKKLKKGKDVFMVELGGGSGGLTSQDKNKFLPYGYYLPYDRSHYINSDNTSCKKGNFTRERCFALILRDNWQIKDDYPW